MCEESTEWKHVPTPSPISVTPCSSLTYRSRIRFLVLGIAGALAFSRRLETMLFGVGAADPVTLGAVSAVLALVAVAACVVPARRGLRVDPLTALRSE